MTKIEVTWGKCKKKWEEDYESESCPYCGRVAKNEEGTRRIQEYYEIAPSIFERIMREVNCNEIFSGIYNDIKGTISLIEIGNLENVTKCYTEMVLGLRQRYGDVVGVE